LSSRRFLAVPYDALGIVGPDHELAVLRLYRRAHGVGWSEFTTTDRALAAEWSCSTRAVRTVLDALEAAELLVLIRGDARKPTRIRVLCPTRTVSQGESEDDPEHGSQPDHNKAPPKPESKNSESHPESQGGSPPEPDSGPSRVEAPASERGEETGDQTGEENTHNGARVLPGWATTAAIEHHVDGDAVLELVVAVVEDIRGAMVNPFNVGPDSRAIIGLWAALGRPATPEFRADVAVVAEACRSCPDPLFARHVRGEGWAGKANTSQSPRVVCNADAWNDRLVAARAWKAAGGVVAVAANPATEVPESAIVAHLDAQIVLLDRKASPRQAFAAHWPDDWQAAVAVAGGDVGAFIRGLKDEKQRAAFVRGFVVALRARGPIDLTWSTPR
jgi:hypothetical protein